MERQKLMGKIDRHSGLGANGDASTYARRLGRKEVIILQRQHPIPFWNLGKTKD